MQQVNLECHASTAWLDQRTYLKCSIVLLFNEKQLSMLQVEELHKEGLVIFFSFIYLKFKISFIYKQIYTSIKIARQN